MKQIAWLNPSKVNPDVIFSEIRKVATVDKSGRVSFSNFQYLEYLGIIQSQLKFPKDNAEIEQEWIVSKAVTQCLQSDKLNKDGLIEVANRVLAEALAKPEEKFHLLTSLSVGKAFPFRRINLGDSTIHFYESQYPQKYKGRKSAISENYVQREHDHRDYIKCVVTTKAKYPKAATNKALHALDYVRACFCLMGNPRIEFNFGESSSKPINIIRLGKYHTLHDARGRAIKGQLWFEPNFYEHAKIPLSHPEVHRNNFNHIQNKLATARHGKDLRNSLVRYVRSCDERDSNTCFVKLWGVLESLLNTEQASHERVVNRGASLFPDKLFHKHALDHLRMFRNKNIHAGEEDDRSKVYCFQLHKYYQALIRFHISTIDFFSSITEANEFLDLPHDESQLRQRAKLIEKALNLRHSTSLHPGMGENGETESL